MKTKSTLATARDLERLADLMAAIGETFGSRIEAHQVELYCRAASADLGGHSKGSQELADEMDLGKSAVSRNLAWFSHRGRNKKPGLRMIEAYPEDGDYRRKPLTLTPKGKRAAKALSKALEKAR